MKLFVVLALVTLAVAGCASKPGDAAASRAAQAAGPLLVDVRTPEEYAAGHLAGAVNVPLNQIQQIASVAPRKDTPIRVHCRSGGRSAKATAALKEMGYTQVTDLGSYENARKTVGQ